MEYDDQSLVREAMLATNKLNSILLTFLPK
jgi:hypothetical protein